MCRLIRKEINPAVNWLQLNIDKSIHRKEENKGREEGDEVKGNEGEGREEGNECVIELSDEKSFLNYFQTLQDIYTRSTFFVKSKCR